MKKKSFLPYGTAEVQAEAEQWNESRDKHIQEKARDIYLLLCRAYISRAKIKADICTSADHEWFERIMGDHILIPIEPVRELLHEIELKIQKDTTARKETVDG